MIWINLLNYHQGKSEYQHREHNNQPLLGIGHGR